MSSISERLSLSTCWCSKRHTDGYAMVEEMRELGFKRIELSHGIRISLVPGILQAVEEGIIEISSVHNFCPLPNSVQHAAPNLYQPSSSDAREIALWKRYTAQTLDFAVKVGADRVVVHSGSVWFFLGSPEAKLDQWIDTAELKTEAFLDNSEFLKRRDAAMKKIRRKARKTMQRIKENYAAMIPLAAERGVRFCLENREAMEELPIDADYPEFLKELPQLEQISYWHDAGHAQIKHQFGLLNHAEHLASMIDRLAGFHLHDVSAEGRDHQVPGTGTVDFKMIASFVRPEHTLVLELSPLLSPDQVRASRDYILETFS